MKCCHVQVYLASHSGPRTTDSCGPGANVKVGMTYDVALESRELQKHGYDWLCLLTHPGVLYPAYKLVQRLHIFLQDKPGLRRVAAEDLVQKVRNWLKGEHWLKQWNLKLLDEQKLELLWLSAARDRERGIPAPELDQHSRVQDLALVLRGRNLYFSEVMNGLRELGLPEQTFAQVRANLVNLLQQGKVEMVPANLPEDGVCLRCGHGELEETECGICGARIWRCPECGEMGESLTCRPIFRRPDQARLGEADLQDVVPRYLFALAPYQEELSHRLEQALQRSKVDWLLWAVCGAGKTETTFSLMAVVLRRGGRVLFTSPRREVVRQMVERIGTAFPETSLIGLYGGSEGKLGQAQLTVSTVHQLVRFYQAFDLVVFDEVDAYPYKGDARLQSLLLRSKKAGGKVVYLSATPGEELLQQAEEGKLELLTLPARFHRKGVPEPELVSLKLPAKADFALMPRQVNAWVSEAIFRDLGQLYIFLPTRRMVEVFGESLQKYFAQNDLAEWVEYTHSQDEERERKVQAFLRGDYPVLVTSTIMERGVTVPKANVLVLYADYGEIFDYQTLIQMAGRAGRSTWAPYGRVIFAAGHVTREMQKAGEWIGRMNEEARKRGLVDAEEGTAVNLP